MGYYECGELWHIKKDCPILVHTNGAGRGSAVIRNQNGGRTHPSNRQTASGSNPNVGRSGVIATTS